MPTIRLAVAISAIVLGLLPLPSMQQRQKPLPFDPMLSRKCPVPTGDCGRGRSLVANRDACCPSCTAYSASAACSPSCLKLNLSATPCFSVCGEAGCQRALCGEPVNGGNSCCNGTKIFSCSIDKIFLGEDCCPECNRGSSKNPTSPAQCRFNKTRGAGQPVCDSFGNCRLKPVDDRRDDIKFSFDLIRRVCTDSDLAPIMQLLGLESMTGVVPKPRPMTSDSTMAPTTTMSPPSLDSMTPAQLKAYLEQKGALLRNMTRLPEMVRRITSPTCREPVACIAKMYNQSALALKRVLDSLKASSIPQLSAIIELKTTLQTKMEEVITRGAACMAKVQSRTPCVAKVQAINMEELLRGSRCNRSSAFEFGLLQSIAELVANETADNRPPGLELIRSLECSELRNPCAVDVLNALMDRIGSGCKNAQLLTMARERMRARLMACTSGQLTDEDLANALVSCQLTPRDIRRISQDAPERLQQVLLNSTEVPATVLSAKAGQPTLGAMLQERLKGCPELKAAIDREVAKNLDAQNTAASTARDLIGALRPAIIGRLATWSSLSAEDLATLSDRLKDDPDREAKCQELVPRVTQASLGSLKSCIDKIPPGKLRQLFTTSADLKEAAQAFNFSAMSPRDIARSASTLRDMLKDVTATSSNCLIYMNSLFSFPRNRIEPSLCRNDTCFKRMCSIMPDHPNTIYCQGKRPAPTASSLSGLGVDVMAQLTNRDLRGALSGTSDKSSFQSLLAKFSDSGSSSSGGTGGSSSAKSGIARRINAKKRRSTISAVIDEFQKTFLQGTNLESFSAFDTDASLLSQLNFEQLRRLPCTEMSVVAYKSKSFLSNVGSGAGAVVSRCVCQSYANCSNITSTALSDIGGFAMFISVELIRRIPTSALPIFCQALQAVSTSEKSTKLSMAHQRLVHEICVAHGDMSGSGGSNDTNLESLTTWNSTVASAVMPCALTNAQIDKLDQSAADSIIQRLAQCPPNGTYLRSICARYFKLYNDSATSGNYSTKLVRACFAFMDTLGNITKVNRDDVRTDCGSVATDAAQTSDSCAERASHGHKGDCDSTEVRAHAEAIAKAQRLMIGFIDSSTGASGRRRKRSASALTCNDIQNLASGVAQVTAAQIQAMPQSEFESCFSTFGLTDAQWTSEQCMKLKVKTQYAFNGTSEWTSSVLLTVGCLTQCWSSAEIAQIPYTDVAHISDIGKYCKLMPDSAKASIVSAYIANAKANDSGQMTRSELSSLGYLACGAPPVYISTFNETNVLNSMTELGTPGPCSDEVVMSYVNRLKASALGSTVANWQTSYFTSLANLIGGLSSSDIPTLSTGQIGYIDASAISGMSASKFKDFTASQLAMFSASQKSAVTSGQLALLSDSQKQALGYTVASGANWLTANILLLVAASGGAYAAGRWQLTV